MIIFTTVICLSSCSFYQNVKNTTGNISEQSNHMKTLKAKVPVKIPTIKEIVNDLCSDEFEGRLIGTKGNEKTEEYIDKIFKEIGLTSMFEPNYYETYTQEVYKKYGLIDKDDEPENKKVNNVVGVIKGKDNKKAVVISAHFDHIGYQDGKIVRGALDNASGVSTIIEIANTLKEKSKKKPFNMDIVICAFNGEEEGLAGSRAFVNDIKAKSMYNSLYNINIDSIGAKQGGTLALKNKSNVSYKLYEAFKVAMKKNNIAFSDTSVIGTGDHRSFETYNIPNVFIVQEGIEKLVHKPTDTPDILDYGQIDKIANTICDFIETNDGTMFDSK